MANWTKQKITPLEIPEGVFDKTITVYHADDAADPPGHLRIVLSGRTSTGETYVFDRAVSELSLSLEQLTMISSACEAATDSVLALEGFTPESDIP